MSTADSISGTNARAYFASIAILRTDTGVRGATLAHGPRHGALPAASTR
jgi:hypothetical protein